MGQYHYVVNLTKFEYIMPFKLGVGLKAREQLHSQASTPHALFLLTMCSNGRGGGDLPRNSIIGRWTGDKVAVVGDYSDAADLPEDFCANTIYCRCTEGKKEPSALEQLAAAADDTDAHYLQKPETAIYRDITELLLPVMKEEFGLYTTDNGGWWEREIRET